MLDNSAGLPSKDIDINRQLYETTHAVKHYINQIKAQPDDFAREHLKVLKESIEQASDALLNYEFKKENASIEFDAAYDDLDNAIEFLTQKGGQEAIKATKVESHEKLASELQVALNSIQGLVSLLENVQESTPIHGIDLHDVKYKRGRKVKKATDEKFRARKPKDGKS